MPSVTFPPLGSLGNRVDCPLLTLAFSEGEGWGEGGTEPVQSPAIQPRDYLAHRDPKTEVPDSHAA